MRNVEPPLLERLPNTVIWTFVLVAVALFWIGLIVAMASLIHLG